MKRIGLTLLFLTLISIFYTLKAQEQKSYDIATIAFYNLENLFDTIIDPDPNKILQDEFTPKGKNAWTGPHYKKKLIDMSGVIADLGADVSKTAPMIVGVSEVENKNVVEDLVNTAPLKSFNYGVVHYESNDRRGIDVALIYRKDFVTIKSSTSRRIYYPKQKDFRTRDQLVVEADIQGESIYIVVNHWPSRRGGEKKSSPKREAAAKLCR
jgi:predicted extracellular nuclease